MEREAHPADPIGQRDEAPDMKKPRPQSTDKEKINDDPADFVDRHLFSEPERKLRSLGAGDTTAATRLTSSHDHSGARPLISYDGDATFRRINGMTFSWSGDVIGVNDSC